MNNPSNMGSTEGYNRPEQPEPYTPYYGPPPTSIPSSPQVEYPYPPSSSTTTLSGRNLAIVAGSAVVALVLVWLALALGGEPSKFMLIGLQFAPFVVLELLAYAGLKNNVAAVFTYLWLAILGFLL